VGGKRIPRARAGDKWCDLFASQLDRSRGLQDYEREFKFLANRKFRFDFAWPSLGVAAEVDGVVHRIKDRFARDREKGNLAVLHNWRVLHFAPAQIKTGEALKTIEAAIFR
jgi:very-short-patch-repair endonuclease